MILKFPKPTPSQNQRDKKHFMAKSKLRDAYQMQIRQQLLDKRIRPTWPPSKTKRSEKQVPVWLFKDQSGDMLGSEAVPPAKVKLTVRRYSNGTLDKGNFIGGCKSLLDALVREGLIFDDSPKWLDDNYEQHKAQVKQGRTEVELEVVGD